MAGVEAGIPLRRQITGDIDVLDAPFYRAHDIEAATATRLASALAERGRPIEAAGCCSTPASPTGQPDC